MGTFSTPATRPTQWVPTRVDVVGRRVESELRPRDKCSFFGVGPAELEIAAGSGIPCTTSERLRRTVHRQPENSGGD